MTLGHSSAEGGASIPGELVARLEAASVGSRELDAHVTVALRLGCKRGLPDDLQYLQKVRKDDECAPGTYWYVCRSGKSLRTAEPVTTSLDAALALAERVLPEANCMGFDRDPKGVDAYVSRNCVPRDEVWLVEARAATPALALCLAILKAVPFERSERSAEQWRRGFEKAKSESREGSTQ